MTPDRTDADEEREEPTTRAEPVRREVLIQSRVFLGVGTIVAVMALIYIFASYEWAGSVMLAVAACLSFVCAGYLIFYLRQSEQPAGDLKPGDHAQYLPHASIWPFWIGVATFLVANGMILGTWFLVPGALLMIAGVTGFIVQTRARQ